MQRLLSAIDYRDYGWAVGAFLHVLMIVVVHFLVTDAALNSGRDNNGSNHPLL